MLVFSAAVSIILALQNRAGCGWVMQRARSELTEHSRRALVVVTDVDGTLMNSSNQLPAANCEALRRCVRQGVPVILATGKHRGPWVRRLLDQVADPSVQALSEWTLNAPGVFVQGRGRQRAAGQCVSRLCSPGRAQSVDTVGVHRFRPDHQQSSKPSDPSHQRTR